MRRLLLLAPIALACAQNDQSPAPNDAGADDGGAVDAGLADTGVIPPEDGGESGCSPADGQTVTLTTDDGIELTADFYTNGIVGDGAAAILLHMTPSGGHDRSNYPREFIEALVNQGVAVINTDRRGVGGSDALKREAYLGPNGKLDAKAAYDFLVGHPCGFARDRIGIAGASNGTTTAMDFAVYAETEASVEVPRALLFLTGGAYTENQNRIDDHRDLLEAIEIMFVYAGNEDGWSEGFQPNAPVNWAFWEYTPGGHGTNMFSVQPTSTATIAGAFAERLH